MGEYVQDVQLEQDVLLKAQGGQRSGPRRDSCADPES